MIAWRPRKDRRASWWLFCGGNPCGGHGQSMSLFDAENAVYIAFRRNHNSGIVDGAAEKTPF